MSNMQEWVNNCLGLWGGGEYLDKIEKNFGIDYDPTDEETIDLIKRCCTFAPKRPSIGDAIAREMFELVVNRAVDELGAIEEDFDYSSNGIYDTYFICKGVTVNNWGEIVALYPDAE